MPNFKFLQILSFVFYLFKRMLKKGPVKAFVAEFVTPAIQLVNVVKAAVDNPKLELLVQLTETDIDDKIKDRAVDILSKAIQRMYNVKQWAEDTDDKEKKKKPTDEQILAKFIEILRGEKSNVQSALLSKMASNIAYNQSRLQKPKVKEFEVDALTSMTYAAYKEDHLV